MINESKHFKVTVFGDTYSLVTDASEETIKHLADRIDLAMKKIAITTQHTDAKKIAVLLALQLAEEVDALKHCLSSKSNKEEMLLKQLNEELSCFSL